MFLSSLVQCLLILFIAVIFSGKVLTSDSNNGFENIMKMYEDNKYLFRRYFNTDDATFEHAIRPKEWTKNKPKSGKLYDFIIVGSGSAGSVIANRLSENPNWRILLLEAGKGENFLTSIPIISPIFQRTEYDWQYLMEYDAGFARGMEDNRLGWPRGKALGGTTVINYMIYTRGNPTDFDRWSAYCCPDWSYDKVLPYFMKSENSTLQYENAAYHGHDGYWSVENIYKGKLTDTFIRGGMQLGYDFVDYASPNQVGFSFVQSNTLRGQRHSIARAFLEPVRERKNLEIVTSATVTKILIDQQNKVAYGVEYVRNKKKYRSFVTKEVIISAGALASPHLLLLSGIGNADHLAEASIPPVHHLPGVGQNLHDHITFVGLNFIVNSTADPLSVTKLLNPGNIVKYFTTGKGPASSLGGVEGIGYIKTDVSEDAEEGFPDIELIFVDASLSTDYGVANRRVMRIRDDVYDKLWGPLHNTPTWTIFPMLLHPRSTGYLHLNTTHPYNSPLFTGNYLSDPHDTQTLIASIRFIKRLSGTPAFQAFNSRLHDVPIPGCEHLHPNNKKQRYESYGNNNINIDDDSLEESDAYWECALRTLSITLHHQVGTCKMGLASDAGAVVDERLKVHGMRGLRVADTSVIPFAITAHTNAPSVMVGERAADFIKEDYSRERWRRY